MTKETEYIIAVLKQHLNGEPSLSKDGINWDEVIAIARKHQIQSILYYQCKSIPEIEKQLRMDYLMCLHHYVQIEETQHELQTIIGDKQCLFFKGMSVARLYPFPPLRSMGDIDMLVTADNLETVDRLLVSHEFINMEKNKDEWIYIRNQICVEVHTALMHHDQKNYDYFNNPWAYVNGEMRDWEYWLLYLLSHLRAHLVAGGIGIRQFYDLAVIIKNVKIDFQCISKETKKMGIDEFSNKIFALLSQWFGIDVPKVIIDSTFFEMATNEILTNGVFGNNQDREIKMGVARTMANRDGNYQTARFLFYCSKLFPPYEVLCEYSYCRFLKGRKYLLPVAWAYRWYISALDSGRRKNASKQLLAPKGKVNERRRQLKQWGIF